MATSRAPPARQSGNSSDHVRSENSHANAQTLESRLASETDRPAASEHSAHPVRYRDPRARHLSRRGPAELPHALLERVHPVHARVHVRKAATVRIERKPPARGRVALADKARRLAALDEA